MMIRKRANQGMILNLDGVDGMRISNVTYCKLNKRLNDWDNYSEPESILLGFT